MTHDTTCNLDQAAGIARVLMRGGQWDDALAVLREDQAAARAEILTDRFFWRLDDPAQADTAITALTSSDPVLAAFRAAQLVYTRLVFQIDPRPGDIGTARAGFAGAAADRQLAGWGTFWLGLLADLIDHDPGTAATAYGRALAHSRQHPDLLLESYALRHQGDHALAASKTAGVAMLRRSYHLRAALGARPQTAAAAATLAEVLEPGEEADQLSETAASTARELRLTWLLSVPRMLQINRIGNGNRPAEQALGR